MNDEARSTWEPIDLGQLEPRVMAELREDSRRLVYPGGRRHLWSGPPESIKTLCAAIVTLEEIRAGGRVVWIDLEMGPHDFVDRLRDLGYSDEELEGVIYIAPEKPAGEDVIAPLVTEWSPTLAVVDASAGAFVLQGLDDYKRGDVEAFGRSWIEPFRRRDVSTIVLDHVVKSAQNRQGWAAGSERKVGVVDVHLGFEAVVPFSRGKRGVVHVSTLKDRLGHLPRPTACEIELRSDPETHAISWTFTTGSSAEAGKFRPTALMERVSLYLERVGRALRTEIYRDVKGKTEWLVVAVNCLLEEGWAAEDLSLGTDGDVSSERSPRIRVVEPFREAFPGFPEHSRNDLSSVPPPLKGGERNGNGTGNDEDDVEFWAGRAMQLEADDEPEIVA